MARPDRRGENFTEAPWSDPVDNGADGIDWPTGTLTPTDLTVEESDGSPSVSPVDTLKFDATDFTLTDGGDGSATVTADEPDAAAHIADSSDAHDASAISIADSGGYFTGTDVEAALQELGAGGGGGGGVVVQDEGTPLATTATTLNFVGAGVTATGAGATKTITIPGGGGGGIIYPLDAARPEDATYFDDFTGASLAGKWTRQTQGSGEESYQQGPDGTHLRVAYSTGAASRYIWQDISSLGTTWTFEAALHVWEGNGGMVGLHCLSSAGTGVGVFFYTSAANFYLGRITTGTYASIGANSALSSIAHYSSGARVWLRLRQVAGVYFGSYSFNGMVYSPEISNTPSAFTQARIGLGRVLGTGAGHVADFDWIDKTA